MLEVVCEVVDEVVGLTDDLDDVVVVGFFVLEVLDLEVVVVILEEE